MGGGAGAEVGVAEAVKGAPDGRAIGAKWGDADEPGAQPKLRSQHQEKSLRTPVPAVLEEFEDQF